MLTARNTQNFHCETICNTVPKPQKDFKQLNIKMPEHELLILQAFCEKTMRSKTNIIREFIRSLESKC